jgi:hypothetical protein
MMAAGQLTFADELARRQAAVRRAKYARQRYAVMVAALDMRRARRRLAAEHAERMAGPKAPTCRCEHGWTADHETCGKCGRCLS